MYSTPKKSFVFILLLILSSCSIFTVKKKMISIDGTYCAEIELFNPRTKDKKQFIQNVEVFENQITAINWEEYVWLPNDHFQPSTLDKNGEADLQTDLGYTYHIKITGPICHTVDRNVARFIEIHEMEEFCPKCEELHKRGYTYQNCEPIL